MRVEYVFYAHRIRISRTEDALCAHRKRITLIARTENALYAHRKRITTLVRIVNALNAHLTCIERTNVRTYIERTNVH